MTNAQMQLCDDDGIVRSGAMHHGTDYPCTGSAHVDGVHIRCTNPAHVPATEHSTEIGSDSAARLASWSCTCGESEVISYARPIGEPVALRLARVRAELHELNVWPRVSEADHG